MEYKVCGPPDLSHRTKVTVRTADPTNLLAICGRPAGRVEAGMPVIG